jgi:hypothetical protein
MTHRLKTHSNDNTALKGYERIEQADQSSVAATYDIFRKSISVAMIKTAAV